MNFDILVRTIAETHSALYQQAVKAVNVNLTIRSCQLVTDELQVVLNKNIQFVSRRLTN